MKDIELWHGDCLEMMATIPDSSFDLAIVDLPFGVTQNDWDVRISLESLWSNLLRTGKRDALFLFFAIFPFACDIVSSKPGLFKYDLIWDKTRGSAFAYSKHRPLRSHENLLVFGRPKSTYNPQMRKGFKGRSRVPGKKPSRNGGPIANSSATGTTRYPLTVLPFQRDDPRLCSVKHPTQKPLNLINWLIKTYSNAGDTVLDPCAGSATTAVAAYQTGRRCIAIEKDAEYYRRGVERVKQAMVEPRQAEMAI